MRLEVLKATLAKVFVCVSHAYPKVTLNAAFHADFNEVHFKIFKIVSGNSNDNFMLIGKQSAYFRYCFSSSGALANAPCSRCSPKNALGKIKDAWYETDNQGKKNTN